MTELSAVAFTLDALAAREALIEGDREGALVMLSPEEASLLGVPEELRLVERMEPESFGTAVACGLGSPLLEKLVAQARGLHPVAWAECTLGAPRLNHARSLAERFTLRNGLCDVLDVTPSEALYLSVSVAWAAEADDRHEGLSGFCLAAVDGAMPDETFGAMMLEGDGSGSLVACAPGRPQEVLCAAPWLIARASRATEEALGAVREGASRRHRRDHERIDGYFRDMAVEASAPRRRVDPAAIAAKVSQIVAERDAKLAALAERFVLRVSQTVATVVCVRVPVALVRLRLRRRKESREVRVRLPAGATELDALSCDGCLGVAPRPAVCDDQLHALCEGCAPSAQGRPRCPACAEKNPSERAKPPVDLSHE